MSSSSADLISGAQRRGGGGVGGGDTDNNTNTNPGHSNNDTDMMRPLSIHNNDDTDNSDNDNNEYYYNYYGNQQQQLLSSFRNFMSSSSWSQNKARVFASLLLALFVVMMVTLLGPNVGAEEEALLIEAEEEEPFHDEVLVDDTPIPIRDYNLNCSGLADNFFGGSFIANAQFLRKRCAVPKKEAGTCPCPDPRFPAANTDSKPWNATMQRNIQLLQPYLNNSDYALDVLFYGDAVIEHMLGTNNAITLDRWKEANDIFLEYFIIDPLQPQQPQSAAQDLESAPDELAAAATTTTVKANTFSHRLHGIPMGIDNNSMQLWYRLQNGEFPAELQVPVIWIYTGMTDFMEQKCSDEAVVAGIMAMVQDVLQQRMNYTAFDDSLLLPRIVIQSILPLNQAMVDRVEHINDLLRCYVEKNSQHLEFFDSTIWLGSMPDHPELQNRTLFHDLVRPNVAGYRVLIPAMAQRVRMILKEQQNELKQKQQNQP